MRLETPPRESGAPSLLLGRELNYRPDIDGLRALAVLLVVLNHAGAALVPGGYVGVDVFFVISGFLISGIIATQRDEGRFSFGAFYLRRAQRLLPALVLVMAATLAFGWRMLTPAGYSELATSALWTLGLASNVFFHHSTSGYFGADASTLPLLHLWSLSVEEQFYLVWPAALLLVLRLRSAALRTAVIALAATASYAWAQSTLKTDPSGAYFLLPARAGEFVTGALVWFLLRSERSPSRLIANLLSNAGLLMLLLAAVRFGPGTKFPGLAALLPCLGTALLLAAPAYGRSLVGRLLESAPAVGVGLISYSVYLWHWPIVSYLQLAQIPLSGLTTLAVVAASLLLGLASWAFVERRFRIQLQLGVRPALAAAGLGAAVFLAGCIGIISRHGLPERFPFAPLTQEQLTAERNRYWQNADLRNTAFAAGDARLKTLIIGNSHGIDLAYALREARYPGAVKLVETTHLCVNFGHDPVLPENAELCRGVLQNVLASPDLRAADVVYLHDHWLRLEEQGLTDMLRKIREVTPAPIVVFGPKMTFTEDPLAVSQRAQAHGLALVRTINEFSAPSQTGDRRAVDQKLKAYFAHPPVSDIRYVSSLDVQCGASNDCPILGPDGVYLYFDAGHFSLAGAHRFGIRLRERAPELFAAAGPARQLASAPNDPAIGARTARP